MTVTLIQMKELLQVFQELLNNFGVKFEDLRKKNPETAKNEKFTFTGDINLKDGKEFQEYNNFIFDTLIKFFKDKVNDLDYFVANKPPEEMIFTD